MQADICVILKCKVKGCPLLAVNGPVLGGTVGKEPKLVKPFRCNPRARSIIVLMAARWLSVPFFFVFHLHSHLKELTLEKKIGMLYLASSDDSCRHWAGGQRRWCYCMSGRGSVIRWCLESDTVKRCVRRRGWAWLVQ